MRILLLSLPLASLPFCLAVVLLLAPSRNFLAIGCWRDVRGPCVTRLRASRRKLDGQSVGRVPDDEEAVKMEEQWEEFRDFLRAGHMDTPRERGRLTEDEEAPEMEEELEGHRAERDHDRWQQTPTPKTSSRIEGYSPSELLKLEDRNARGDPIATKFQDPGHPYDPSEFSDRRQQTPTPKIPSHIEGYSPSELSKLEDRRPRGDSIATKFQDPGRPVAAETASMEAAKPLARISGMQGAVRVFVETLAGDTITMFLKATHTIDIVKAMIAGKVQDSEDIQPDQFKLTFAGEQLEDDRTLSDYNLREESTLRMAMCCVCGRTFAPGDNFCPSCGQLRAADRSQTLGPAQEHLTAETLSTDVGSGARQWHAPSPSPPVPASPPSTVVQPAQENQSAETGARQWPAPSPPPPARPPTTEVQIPVGRSGSGMRVSSAARSRDPRADPSQALTTVGFGRYRDSTYGEMLESHPLYCKVFVLGRAPEFLGLQQSLSKGDFEAFRKMAAWLRGPVIREQLSVACSPQEARVLVGFGKYAHLTYEQALEEDPVWCHHQVKLLRSHSVHEMQVFVPWLRKQGLSETRSTPPPSGSTYVGVGYYADYSYRWVLGTDRAYCQLLLAQYEAVASQKGVPLELKDFVAWLREQGLHPGDYEVVENTTVVRGLVGMTPYVYHTYEHVQLIAPWFLEWVLSRIQTTNFPLGHAFAAWLRS